MTQNRNDHVCSHTAELLAALQYTPPSTHTPICVCGQFVLVSLSHLKCFRIFNRVFYQNKTAWVNTHNFIYWEKLSEPIWSTVKTVYTATENAPIHCFHFQYRYQYSELNLLFVSCTMRLKVSSNSTNNVWNMYNIKQEKTSDIYFIYNINPLDLYTHIHV